MKPFNAASDQRLVQAHRYKVDARIREMDGQVANMRQESLEAERAETEVSHWMQWELSRMADAPGDQTLFRTREMYEHAQGLDPLRKEQTRLQTSRRNLCARAKTLLAERAAISHIITLEAFASSAVRRLPADIILEIFKSVKTAVEGMPETALGCSAGPLLSRVCAEWRVLACDYALLWSSFSFELFGIASAAKAGVYLTRSKSAALTVEIDARRRVESRRPMAERALDLLSAHSHRLFELRLTGSNIPSLPAFRGNLQCLEILRIPAGHVFSTEFELVPRLHTLQVDGRAQLTETEHKFDRRRIRRLTLRNANGHLLVRYPNVTELTCLQLDPPYEIGGPPPPPPAVSPGLTALTVKCDKGPVAPGSNISNILDSFTTPALRSLNLEFHGVARSITDLIYRSQCNLTKLVLRDCSIRITALLQILQLTPALESFAAVRGLSTMMTDRIFEHLTNNGSANLPRLSQLTVNGAFAFHTVVLVEMLETRTARWAASFAGQLVCLGDVFLALADRQVEGELLHRLRRLDGVAVLLECLDSRKVMHDPL
ncbi:hypothetical protein C8R47DRAFT_1255600 [Mycena vitilis]|nr:hypothetical protein C8R47DRAFT_1255600 [Mycena vitilis]